MPLVQNSIEGTLTIDGISMNPGNGAWGVFGDERGEGGLVRLWVEFDVRGEDRILPSVTGVIAYQRRITVTRKDLRLLVVGDVNGISGLPVLDSRIGLQDNLQYLRSNVFDPVDSNTGTRPATLTLPDGGELFADIHVLGVKTQTYHLSECGSIWVGTLQISIPGGRFSGDDSS
jgi:hypothetical protein